MGAWSSGISLPSRDGEGHETYADICLTRFEEPQDESWEPRRVAVPSSCGYWYCIVASTASTTTRSALATNRRKVLSRKGDRTFIDWREAVPDWISGRPRPMRQTEFSVLQIGSLFKNIDYQ